jgi:hypothetical protein
MGEFADKLAGRNHFTINVLIWAAYCQIMSSLEI